MYFGKSRNQIRFIFISFHKKNIFCKFTVHFNCVFIFSQSCPVKVFRSDSFKSLLNADGIRNGVDFAEKKGKLSETPDIYWCMMKWFVSAPTIIVWDRFRGKLIFFCVAWTKKICLNLDQSLIHPWGSHSYWCSERTIARTAQHY